MATYKIGDLRIEQDILPFFDFTLNDYAKDRLADLLCHPLQDIEEINDRQAILKSFIANRALWERHVYHRIDFMDAYRLIDTAIEPFSRIDKLKYHYSKSQRNLLKGDFLHFIRFFHKIYVNIIEPFDDSELPPAYTMELEALRSFFSDLKLAKYYNAIKKGAISLVLVFSLRETLEHMQKEDEVRQFLQRFFRFEAYMSIARGIHMAGYTFPMLGASNFSLRDAYHPLLKNPICNSFTSDKTVIVLTGPNMSGKSTFLKTISLCVYLAHVGLAIPAAAGTIPFYQNLAIFINHTDNLQEGYSHFKQEIVSLKTVLEQAHQGVKSFAVFDELFKGTNIDDAVAITKATITGLTKFKGSIFFISTHINAIKQDVLDADQQIDAYLLSCDVDAGIPKFGYTIAKGWSDLKIGQIIFEMEGLNSLLRKNHE